MIINSKAFSQDELIPERFSCDGMNISPELQIRDVPENAKSLALIMDDPDAPRGRFVHWTLWNIDPGTATISEETIPEGATEGVTTAGHSGYMGPCPPGGTHRYFFKLYALDTELDLSPSASPDQLEESVRGHVVGYAELVGLYSRP